jgi:hypothetical protein
MGAVDVGRALTIVALAALTCAGFGQPGERSGASPVAIGPEPQPTLRSELAARPETASPMPPATPSEQAAPKPPEPTDFWNREHVVPPLIWGCSDEFKLQFGGSQMIRWENRRNFDLDSSVDDDPHGQFLRTLLNLELTAPCFRAFLEVIDADARGWAVDPLWDADWDIYQAFVELKDAPDSPWTLRLGRMILPLHPEGRLWGRPPVDYYWFNFLPNFDGVMLDYKTKEVEVHTFFLQSLTNRSINRAGIVRNDDFEQIDSRWFWGSIATFRDCAPHEYEFYFFGLNDNGDNRFFPPPPRSEAGEFGELEKYTIGSRVRGPIKKWEGCGTLGYGLEAAWQWGQQANDDISAYMLHADINYEWDHPWKPKLTLLGNLASGDRDHNDGELNTFDPLFGSSHYGYGTIDFFRLSNMRELGLTFSLNPCKEWKILAEVHRYWLDSPSDAWVGPYANFGRDVNEDGGNQAGTEFDLTLTYQPNKRFTFEAGAAHFRGGDWPQNRGRNDNASFLFLQTTFKF